MEHFRRGHVSSGNGPRGQWLTGATQECGMLGFAHGALREATFGAHADGLLMVRHETLTANPAGTLAAIYNFLGEELFAHGPAHIEPCYDMIEFDVRLGAPGLHDAGRAVRAEQRRTILPPDLFERYAGDAFWQDPKQAPQAVQDRLIPLRCA